MIRFQQGSLLASFVFLFFFSFHSHAQVSLENIAHDPQWLALLHIDSSGSRLDPNYLLSNSRFSSSNELSATIKLFENKANAEISCKYIARHYFLTILKEISLPPINCPDFWTFTQKAPANKINLIFASENLSQPASIMGHTMLSLSNLDDSIQHSVAFSAEQNTNNPIRLVWDYLIKGQPGQFQLKPFEIHRKQYLNIEQRNLWSFPLKLSSEQTELLQRHIWELKHNQMTYSFASHNCATLIMDLLRVVEPSILEHRTNWLSPIDVVKAAYEKNVINTPSLNASSSWKVRLLSEYTNPLNTDQQIITDEKSTILAGLLSHQHNLYQYETGQKTQKDWQQSYYHLTQSGFDPSVHQIQLDTRSNPVHKPDDSQWGIGKTYFSSSSWYRLRWMPASHKLMDDTNQYGSENELKLLDLSLRTSRNDIELDYAHLYSIQSYINDSELIEGFSGRFNVGIDRFSNVYSVDKLALFLHTGLGKTYFLHKDISVYGLILLNLHQDSQRFFSETGPEVGVFFKFVGNMKSRVAASQTWLNGRHKMSSYSWQHALNYWEDWNIDFEFTRKKFNNDSLNQSNINFSYRY